MASVDERETASRVEGCFDLVVASKTYQQIFENVSLSIFNSGLEDLLIR